MNNKKKGNVTKLGSKALAKPASKKEKAKKVQPAATPEQIEEARRMLHQQMVGREYAPVSHDTLSKSVTYVTAGNGLFKVRKTPVAIFKERVAEFKGQEIGLPDMEEGVELAIPKLPFKYLMEILSFYRDVNDKDGTEASTFFFYNHNDVSLPDVPGLREEDRVITYCPVQTNSKALSSFEEDEWVPWFRENTGLLLEFHSHNTMSSFFSGTDDANENNTQFYGVWGNVDKEIPSMSFRYVSGDAKVEISPYALFEWPIVKERVTTNTVVSKLIEPYADFITEEAISSTEDTEFVTDEYLYEGPFNQVEYPEDWMAQHKKKLPSTTSYGRYGSYGYYGAAKKTTTKTTGKKEPVNKTTENFYGEYYYDDPYYDQYYGQYDQTMLFESEEELDELDFVAFYPENYESAAPSPVLHQELEEFLKKFREFYPEDYEDLTF